MRKIFKITTILSTIALLISCETSELDLLDDPNALNQSVADPSYLLNDVQLSFNNIMNDFNNSSLGVIRMRNQFGTYPNAADPVTTINGDDGAWSQTYKTTANINILETQAESSDNGLHTHLGMAHLLEAYIYVTMVDYIGDVPFSQSNNPVEFPLPMVDSGSSIYNAMFDQIDLAIADLTHPDAVPVQSDLYFDGDIDKWVALANSLKIKMYNQIRLVDADRARNGINAIIGSQNYIDTNEEDFVFQYGTEQNLVESRHPFFTGNWQAGGAGTYMSNGFLDMLNAGDDQPPFIESGSPDPRLRYYIYRQTSNAPAGSTLPCSTSSIHDYCYVGNLYWGRDHTDTEGIPNDGLKRSTYGIYPGGGAFDKDGLIQARQAAANGESLDGAGIAPHYLASFTKFTLAESALTLGTSGNASSLLEEGIRLSMDKVKEFGNVGNGDGFAMTQDDIDDYATTVIEEYDLASDNNAKLSIIVREYYIAAFGNGRETYFNYKRTGYPNLQSPIFSSGSFPRSYRYPADEITANPNITQNPLTNQVFWDANAPGFID